MPSEQATTYRSLRAMDGLSLQYCHCSGQPGDRSYEEEHSSFSVSLVERGVFSYRSSTGDAVLAPGWLMLGNDGDAYVCSHQAGDGRGDDCIVLGFSPEIYEELQSALGQASGPFEQPSLPPLPRVAALLKSLVASRAEGFALEEAALAAVAEIQRAASGLRPSAPPYQSRRAVAAARYLEDHAAEPVSLSRVADEAGSSPYHFLRSFRQAIGVTPHQYLMRMRLIRALALLRDTSLPVTEVGYAAGWADLSNFMRTFRREIGCSPREFRRNKILAVVKEIPAYGAGKRVPTSLKGISSSGLP